jgi:hypothetical protein
MQISFPVHSRMGFFTKVAGLGGKQAVDPADQLILGLAAELRLAVHRPAQKPAGILAVTMPPVTTLPEEGSRLQIFSMYGGIFVVQRGDGGGLIQLLCSGCGAELVGMAEGRILRGNLAPQIPAAAFLQIRW